ncbi:SAM-dependent methyltransferase [Salinibacter sp. 10B]|uniref:SAM-dependent methyltransferase n=1 Tax=Salinibacter sp. 10B TaxID=1923971 RepID=UPI000CF42B7A|nr:class I SAM-dependent methyltransferase [Salinibacter sp. 10B]PQJ34147.1 SAM-dependent methyltransferase [Salinibacter sp. 10B]
MSSNSPRPSSQPSFWDERYAANDHLFGTEPNAFVASQVHHLPPGGDVLELAAGEGRTLAYVAEERGAACTALDFSRKALEVCEQWAHEYNLPMDTRMADVRTWTPDRQWDAVLVTFLQLLPDERTALYRTIRRSLRPGGIVIGEWFRPDHLSGNYDRLGPSTEDRMVPVAELRAAFGEDELLRCEPVDVTLEEGPLLRGEAAVARLVARRAT